MTDGEMISAIAQVDEIVGMTVNERLYASELMKKFDNELKADKVKAGRIVELFKVDRPSIETIVE